MEMYGLAAGAAVPLPELQAAAASTTTTARLRNRFI
jgi:hypothetical protein